MSWRWEGRSHCWRHSSGKTFSQEMADHYPRCQVQEMALRFTGEELPEEAWPPPPPQAVLGMVMAAHEVRKKLASVDDVRELYT